MYCQNGDCGTCTPGANCSTGNLCEIGSTSCATGRATCVKSGSNTGALCSAQSCSANLQKSAAYCTSSGTCPTAATTTCAYGCNGNVCQTLKPNGSVCAASSECQSGGCRFDSTSGNYICTNCGTLNAPCCMNYDECSGGYYCDSQTSCKAQKTLGDACSSSAQCLSGYCSMAGYCVSSCGLKGDGCCAGGNCSTSALYCVRPTGAGWYCLPCGVSGSFCCVSPAQACETGLTCNTNTSTCN